MKLVKFAVLATLLVSASAGSAEQLRYLNRKGVAIHGKLLDQRMLEFRRLLRQGMRKYMKNRADRKFTESHDAAKAKGLDSLMGWCYDNSERGSFLRFEDCGFAVWATSVVGHGGGVDNPDSSSSGNIDEARAEQLAMRQHQLEQIKLEEQRNFCRNVKVEPGTDDYPVCDALFFQDVGVDKSSDLDEAAGAVVEE